MFVAISTSAATAYIRTLLLLPMLSILRVWLSIFQALSWLQLAHFLTAAATPGCFCYCHCCLLRCFAAAATVMAGTNATASVSEAITTVTTAVTTTVMAVTFTSADAYDVLLL